MTHHTTPTFWKAYDRLPDSVQRHADRCFELLKADPQHPSLRLKEAGRYWAARVGLAYRVLAIGDGSNFLWFWIGPHTTYDRLIK